MAEPRAYRPAPWLEEELASHLHSVAAPADLWERLEKPDIPAAQPVKGWRVVWPVPAFAMLALAAVTWWQFSLNRDPALDVRDTAVRDMANSNLDFRTGNCAELQDWLKSNAKLDVPLPANPVAVEVLGARLIERHGSRIAAIAYRVAVGAATLFVGRARSRAKEEHPVTRIASLHGSELISWSMRDQAYALVSDSPGDPRAGCRLCHAR